MAESVGVALLNWHNADDTLRCLESLRLSTYPALFIVVVDNASADDSCARIERAFPSVHLIRNAENEGFTGGMNAAVARALREGCDHVFVLNNDTVVAPDCVALLVETMRSDPRIAEVGALVMDAHTGTIDNCGGVIHWETAEPRHVAKFEADRGQYVGVRDVEYVPGTAVLVRAEAIRQVGPMTADYFAYFEDTDWSLRFRKAGWRTVVDPRARVTHWESSAAGLDSPLKLYYYVRNNWFFARRWEASAGGRFSAHRLHWKFTKIAVKNLLRRRGRHLRAITRGYRDHLAGRMGRAHGRC